MLPPAGEGGEPGFDTSRIYDHVGARSCRHRLCLEGGYDGANDGGWSDALADRDSGARADSFLANHWWGRSSSNFLDVDFQQCAGTSATKSRKAVIEHRGVHGLTKSWPARPQRSRREARASNAVVWHPSI